MCRFGSNTRSEWNKGTQQEVICVRRDPISFELRAKNEVEYPFPSVCWTCSLLQRAFAFNQTTPIRIIFRVARGIGPRCRAPFRASWAPHSTGVSRGEDPKCSPSIERLSFKR
mmetsp:Transcript_77371/g.125525  ORF Transcript_77371/g.125525 Transcript_77371/m.125525 type:complete len:113 (-) Transcript_77371:784-1122(-)